MRISRLLTFLVIAALAVPVASAQSMVTVYAHDFESAVGPEWSKYLRSTTPVGSRTFLGEFTGEPVWLELHDLPDHCRVTVSFELFIINSWEGSLGWNAGPDVWDLNVSSGPPSQCPLENLLHTSFANCECDYQAYPSAFPGVYNPGLTDADEVNTLGYDVDSVYYLTFSFFHDAEDLYFEFQASPDLQGINDESWGIDNITVQMDTDQRYCCRTVRGLPAGYGAGTELPVYIGVSPDPRSQAWVVEEMPPTGWTINYINEGGLFEAATGKIKWGPFFDDQNRLLAYAIQPPSDASGDHEFSGIASFDGESEPICGETVLAPGGYHPADLDHDWMLEADELTAYAAAWFEGDPWTNDFHPITAELVTNAGFIWRSGESYAFDATVTPPWSPTGGGVAVGGTAVGELRRGVGRDLQVAIHTAPGAGIHAWAVEDRVPAGWQVTEVSHGGRVDPETNQVRWGPFFDDQPRSLTYTAAPADGQPFDRVSFAGIASYDGQAVTVKGVRSIVRGISTGGVGQAE
jgi:hypothetical protein